MVDIIVKIIGVYVASVGFALIINVPPKALNVGGIVSVASYFVYLAVNAAVGGFVAGNVAGAFAIGVFSFAAAVFKKMPIIDFNIPALVPLVPGGQAYLVMKYLALDRPQTAFNYLMQVLLIAGAIAIGFLLAELATQVFIRLFVSIKKAI